MISAAACYTAGEYLGTLRHALLELCYVLIINELRSVRAELANLFSAALNGTCGSLAHFLLFSHCIFLLR